jgi:hypothetical protein
MHHIDLQKASPVAVHFVFPDEVKSDLGTLGLTVMEASVADVITDKELFSVISSAMQFPDYFGNNWDALDECLGDMEWLPSDGYLLVLRDAAIGWAKSPYQLGRFVTSWLEASEYWTENSTPFHLLFVM